MAQIPNIGSLTINPVEVQDLREMIARAVYQNADFLKFHTVVDGITKKTQILLDDSSGRAGWKATGCAVVASGGMSIKLAQMFWETVTIEDMLDYCQADLDVNFKPLVLRNSKDKFGDLEDQEAIKTFVYASVVRYLTEAFERLAWLGDTEAENVTDSGYVKDAIDVKFYTPLDGIWKQVFTAVTAGTCPRFTVAANAQATKALQLSTLTDAAAFAIVKGVFDKADDALKLDPNAYIRVTAGVYNGYKNHLAASTLSGGGLSEKTIDGIANPAYMGIPIFTSVFESKVILNDFEISTGSPAVLTYNLPHRAIMATPDLLPAATINMEDIGALESFYEQKDRKSYVRFDFDIDVKVVRPDMISVAY